MTARASYDAGSSTSFQLPGNIMKNLSMICKTLVISAVLIANAAFATDLEIVIQGASQAKGDVLVSLFNQKNQWLKQAVSHKKLSANGEKLTVKFEDLAEGEYAIAVIHDVNANGKLDSNLVGMPTEPYGFSNDAAGNFGPPSFEDAKISLTAAKKSIVINLN
jgi:uncharacterized protein (DUF2141 family)